MATVKLFRCHNPNCQAENAGKFAGEQPVCPQCRIEANDPKFGHLIERQPLIHYDPPSRVPGYGQSVRACDGRPIQAQEVNGIPSPWHGGTGNVFVVTCPKCKETAEYRAERARQETEEAANETLKAASDRLPVTITA